MHVKSGMHLKRDVKMHRHAHSKTF